MAIGRLTAHFAAGVSGCAMLALCAGTAAAAQQAAATQNKIETVVVTAQFRKQDLQKTPLAITAIDAAMLQQRGQTSIVDVAKQTPDLTLLQSAPAFGPSITASIRGVGQGDSNPALEPGVGMYIDDVYYATLTGSVFDLLDLSRVEILRGPQGTLAGMNSIGGAVKLYSQKPDDQGGGYLQASYGGYQHVGARGNFDAVLVPGKLFMRVAAATEHQQGYVTRLDYACVHPGSPLVSNTPATGCVLGHEGGKAYTGGRVMLRWLPTSDLEVNLIADYTDDQSENAPATLLYAHNLNPNVALNGVPYDSRFIPTDPYANYATFYMPGGTVAGIQTQELIGQDHRSYRGGGVSGEVNWHLPNGMDLKSITAYRTYSADWAEDNDLSPLPLALGIEHMSHVQFSQELRLNGSLFDDAVDYTVGGFYFRENSAYPTHQDLRYVAPQYDWLARNDILAHSKAGFVHAVWHVTGKLDLTAGARYSTFDKTDKFGRLNRDFTPSSVFGSLNGSEGHYSGSHWDYRANLSYQWTPNLMTYAQVSTGFKGGGVNPRPFVVGQEQAFGPETLTAYEVGFKSTLFDHRVRLNGAAFFNKYKQIQLTLLSCPQYSPPIPNFPCALPANAGDADVKGAELEAEAYPIDGLQIDASGSYLDFSYTYINPLAGGPTQPRGVQYGMVMPYAPQWKWSLGVQYDINIADAGVLTPRLDASYQGTMYTSAVNGPYNRVDPRMLLNGRLSWQLPDRSWQVALKVTNLTNKLYYLTKFDLHNSGFVSGEPGMPRQWMITVGKHF